ncbi:MAG: [FeFe] hydrogenase H-cluster radical SAM maturase HydE, partial [Fervidicoccus fontis]
FIPHPQTPLKSYPAGSFDLMLRVFALTRIVTKNTHIAAANTVATLKPENGQLLCFLLGGCNVLMPNCNPFPKSREEKVEFEFQCAPAKRYVDIEEAESVIKKAELQISKDKGHSLKLKGDL